MVAVVLLVEVAATTVIVIMAMVVMLLLVDLLPYLAKVGSRTGELVCVVCLYVKDKK